MVKVGHGRVCLWCLREGNTRAASAIGRVRREKQLRPYVKGV